MSAVKIIGIVLLVVGVIVLALGAYDLITFNDSFGGKAANKITGLFGQKTETVQKCIVQIAVGAVASVVGLVLFKKGK